MWGCANCYSRDCDRIGRTFVVGVSYCVAALLETTQMSTTKCEYCDDTGGIEIDNNGPIGKCPLCEIGRLSATIFEDDFTYNNKPIHVAELEGYVCDECGADPIFADQIRRNHLKISKAKAQIK